MALHARTNYFENILCVRNRLKCCSVTVIVSNVSRAAFFFCLDLIANEFSHFKFLLVPHKIIIWIHNFWNILLCVNQLKWAICNMFIAFVLPMNSF